VPNEPAPVPTIDATASLAALEGAYGLSARWRDGSFAWFKQLGPGRKGALGETLVRDILTAAGQDVTGRTNSGHDLAVNGVPVEVKLATELDFEGVDQRGFIWQQLRPAADWALVALVGVEPDRARIWLVERDVILAHAIGQHSGAGATETRMVTVRTNDLPAWLGDDLATAPDRWNQLASSR
jgi:hypothetical protein